MRSLKGPDHAFRMVKDFYRLINRFKSKKMIEARTNGVDTTPQAETPQTITVSMILEDLESGTDRSGIQTKYGLKTWEVTEMFKHPALKGRKAKKVRKLSFNFVDDTITDPNQTSIPVEDTVEDASSMLYGVDNTNVEATDTPDTEHHMSGFTRLPKTDDLQEQVQDVDDTLEF